MGTTMEKGTAIDVTSLLNKLNDMTMTWEKLLRNETEPASVAEAYSGIKILVLDKGFVYIGKLAVDTAHRWAYITDAWNVRYWGTTRGLGQLSRGPTSKTEVDPVGRVQIPFNSLLQIIDVRQDKWDEFLFTKMNEYEKEFGI